MFGGQHTPILSNDDDKEIHRNLISFFTEIARFNVCTKSEGS